MVMRWIRWRHSRHSVLVAGLCLLTVMVSLDSSRLGCGAEQATGCRRTCPGTLGDRSPPAPPTRSIDALSPGGPPQRRRHLGLLDPAAPAETWSADRDLAVTHPVSAGGGATVVISGSGFSQASAVYFGPNQSSSSPCSLRRRSWHAPANAGSVGVSVTTPVGVSRTPKDSELTYTPTGQLPITASGRMELGGVPVKFTGVNGIWVATDWGTNLGCGGMETPAQIASLFSSLAPP